MANVLYPILILAVVVAALLWLGRSRGAAGLGGAGSGSASTTPETDVYLPSDASGQAAIGTAAAAVPSPFIFGFAPNGTIEEAGSIAESQSPYWWVNSGAMMRLVGGEGETNFGDLPAGDPWRLRYAANNPTDTDGGVHPQNIFRLITRSTWENFSQEAYFRVVRDDLSDSPNRNESNGILLFSRYKSSQNLYYAGLRVDGHAIIKKKSNGVYYTIAEAPYIPGAYDRSSNPDLLPKNQWIGVRSDVVTGADGSVNIKLYIDQGRSGKWQLVLNATDDGRQYGGPALTGSGYAGIRTDFMDVAFSQYVDKKI